MMTNVLIWYRERDLYTYVICIMDFAQGVKEKTEIKRKQECIVWSVQCFLPDENFYTIVTLRSSIFLLTSCARVCKFDILARAGDAR